MRVLAHLSDIHFGAEDPVLIEALRLFLVDLGPDLTIVSGDLTQRAKICEYEQARAYLKVLPGQKIVVPGNHDVPLWNFFIRFLAPYRRYCRYITQDLAPTYFDDEIAVVGINTARAFTRKNGRINEEQADEVCEALRSVEPGILKIVVTHHPFDLAETFGRRKLVRRAHMAMKKLAAGGAEVLLAGHWHEAYTGGTAKRYPLGDYSALVIQAGTATSVRRRLSSNSFNILRYEAPFLAVEIMSWDVAAQRYVLQETKRFWRKEHGGVIPLDKSTEAAEEKELEEEDPPDGRLA